MHFAFDSLPAREKILEISLDTVISLEISLESKYIPQGSIWNPPDLCKLFHGDPLFHRQCCFFLFILMPSCKNTSKNNLSSEISREITIPSEITVSSEISREI